MSGKLLGDTSALSDAYLLSKLQAAESDASRRLRVSFAPSTVFAYEPTADEITALGVGASWSEESPYDYEPHLWNAEDWGYLVLRQKPVIIVEQIRLAYPAPTTGFFTIPLSWVRVDKKAGHIRFVPSAAALQAGPLSTFILSAMGGGRNIPQMIQVRYRAGLENVVTDWPDIIDVIKKMAVLRLVQDAFLPQSGSISADGLSQSTSVQMQDYHDGIDAALDALFSAIHGPVMAVL